MYNLRNISDSWANKTYLQGLSELNLSKKEMSLCTSFFDQLHILDIPMDGFSCEKLPKTEEQRLGISITYSEIFHSEVEKGNFTPATYLVRLINECQKANVTEAKIIGALARGLRTLTSLLREPDFAYQLENSLNAIDSKVTTSLNSKQDSSDHTDVLLIYKQQTYRIWLYQFSSRGLPHDIERMTGKRGELPDGIHLICPLHTELALNYSKLQKKYNTLNSRLLNYQEKLDSCSPKAVKAREKLIASINSVSSSIQEMECELEEQYILSSNELDIVNGWFFYSKSHIERIIQYINSNATPIPYQKVVETLSAPEHFVGNINSFRKGDY